MSNDSKDGALGTAMDQLESFGLSSYAAETFVTLVALAHGTAKDVSEASAVPRTRVYDAVEELEEQGLVHVEYSSPREFHPISVETARRRFAEDSQRRIDRLTEALMELEPVHAGEVQPGVWTVRGAKAVTDRVVDFVESADDEVLYATGEEILPDGIPDHLQAAADRGVSVQYAGTSETTRQRLSDSLDVVRPYERVDLRGVQTGRVAMVDGERILVSVLANDDTDDRDSERAIWATDPSNPLVQVLKATVGGQFFAAFEK
jgi:sugar-specific transcriptional regulator TrmB